nr:MAG TPA: hypothetical protein [Caudoviricetes sp.]
MTHIRPINRMLKKPQLDRNKNRNILEKSK